MVAKKGKSPNWIRFILVLVLVAVISLILVNYIYPKLLGGILSTDGTDSAEEYYLNNDPHAPDWTKIPLTYRKKPEGIYLQIPPVPPYSNTDYVHRLSKDILVEYLKLEPRKYIEKILILTPIHNSAKSLEKYALQLHELKYPHAQISIAFGEDGSSDNTVQVTQDVIKELKKSGFSKVSLYSFNMSSKIYGDFRKVHEKDFQYQRRRHLAQARNLLLNASFQNEDYVLWIDSDIKFLPDDLVEQLLFAKKDVVAATCLYNSGKYVRIYDKNSWRETPRSLEEQAHLPDKSQLIVEGYDDTSRIYLSHLRAEGRIVKLDGVGGCTLLIKGKCHKNGLKFPEEVFNHHIETEGLAKLALSMGYGVYGLPFLEVFHT